MTLITKPDFTYVWASGGAVVAPNDAKKQLGWVAEAPPFQYDNWLQNRQDQMLAHINQRGIPAWDALTNYEAGSLSYVQGSDGKIYKSVAASGPTAVVSNPTTDLTDTYWTEAFASICAFLTQTASDTRYTQRSNNLNDVTNAATSFSNIKQPASETETGVVELATLIEMATGASTSLVPTVAAVMSLFNKRVFAANDFIRVPDVPGGLIIQWGRTTDTNSTTFPITFPTSALAIYASYDSLPTASQASTTARILTTSTFSASWGTVTGDFVYWLAIGY